MDRLRNKALAGLGPQTEMQLASAKPVASRPAAPSVVPAPNPAAPVTSPRPRQSFDLGVGSGSGPVGPILIGLLFVLRRVRGRRP